MQSFASYYGYDEQSFISNEDYEASSFATLDEQSFITYDEYDEQSFISNVDYEAESLVSFDD